MCIEIFQLDLFQINKEFSTRYNTETIKNKCLSKTALVFLNFHHNHVNVHQLRFDIRREQFMESIIILHKLRECQLQNILSSQQ